MDSASVAKAAARLMLPIEGRHLPAHLAAGEEALAVASIQLTSTKQALLVATDVRLLTLRAAFSKDQVDRQFRWRDASTLSRRPPAPREPGTMVLEFRGPSVAETLFCFDGWESIVRVADERLADNRAARDPDAAHAHGAVDVLDPDPVDVVGGLTALTELWRSGALSDDEFAAAKRRLLGT
ncbi:MAG: hypothetical protein JWM34_1764 [Ilumatobacteraceae bacterium]|nr:hypothetical protein [Ilumatobacteraceae bacterium]